MTHGDVAALETPVMQRIAAVWRADGTFEERLMATMAAAEKECPGLFLAIVRSKGEQLDWQDYCYRRHFEELDRSIAACTSDTIRAARKKARDKEMHDYWMHR